MSEEKFVITVLFTIKPEHMDDFRTAIVKNAALSVKNEAGCLHFDVCEDTAQSCFFLYEIYENAAAFDVHLETAHFKHFNAVSAPWVSGKALSRYKRLATPA